VAESKNIPLAVDLDGTLIRSDVMWESLARLLRKNPFAIFAVLFWLLRGRALLKQKLGAKVQINPTELEFNEKFLAWLREEKKSGRKIILATASDLKMAQPVADYVGLFDEVLASDGKINLRSENKLRALTEKFGERGFDYAGNSSADFAVWRGVREAIVVNASPMVLAEAKKISQVGAVFCENFSALTITKSVVNELFLRSGYLVALVSGLLLALAFPKTNVAGFAWIAPALLVFAALNKNAADAFRVGVVAGFAFWLASLYWLLLIPYPFFPVLGWLALAGFLSLYSGAWTWLVAGFKVDKSNWSTRLLWSLAAAAAWVALEMLRAKLFGGFPWSLLGVSQYQLVPLIQIAAVTGVYGVSFLVVWFSLALFCAAWMIWKNPSQRFVWQAEVALPLVTVIGIFTGGIFFNSQTSQPTASLSDRPVFLRVTLIQPAIPQSVIWNPASDEKLFEKFLAQNETALTNATDLVVWPESAVPVMDDDNVRAISAFAARHHVWLILNGEDVSVTKTATNFFNAAFLVNPDGLLTATYHKQKLVIFGEYVPLEKSLGWLMKLFTPIDGSWTPGEKSVTFKLDGLGDTNKIIALGDRSATRRFAKTAVLICFEDTFATVARGAAQDDLDFLVNLTNDGWFGNSAEQWQHLANAVFRCVENGLPLLRCANNGVTGFIDAHGRVQTVFRDGKNSEYGVGVLRVELPLPASAEKSGATFYHRHGDWFGWGCVGLTAILVARRSFRRSG
jgi:apolipoprotein N-acyltransferase